MSTLLKADKDEAIFLIQIDAKTFEKALMEEYLKATAAEDKKPAPALLSNEALLRQYPALEKIAGTALDKLMPSYYMSAVKELGIHPLTFPTVILRAMDLGQPCVVEVRVALEPDLELKQFEGLEATYTPVLVTEEDLTQQLAGLRKHHGSENDDSKLLKNLPFASIEALTEEMCSSLTAMAKEKTDFNRKEAVLKQLLEANPLSVKDEIVEQQIMIEINQIRKQMGPQAMENYMKSSGRKIDDLKGEVHPQAEKTVKKNLLLSAIAEKITPEVTEEDINAIISEHPNSFIDFNGDYEISRKRIEEIPGALDQIKHSIRMEKALDYVVANAKLHENKPTKIMDELPEYMK